MLPGNRPVERRRPDQEQEPLTGEVRKFEAPEQENVDVLRVAFEPQYYGQIISIEEMQEPDKGLVTTGLVFDCISKPWFDQLQEDLSDLPPMNTIAKVARTCLLEVFLPNSKMDELSSSLEANQQLLADLERVHISQGWWLEIRLSNDSGYPVHAYLPSPDSDDPSSVTEATEPVKVYLQNLSRVRPPRSLIKLHRLAGRT